MNSVLTSGLKPFKRGTKWCVSKERCQRIKFWKYLRRRTSKISEVYVDCTMILVHGSTGWSLECYGKSKSVSVKTWVGVHQTSILVVLNTRYMDGRIKRLINNKKVWSIKKLLKSIIFKNCEETRCFFSCLQIRRAFANVFV